MKLKQIQEARTLAPPKRDTERESMDDLGSNFPKEPKSEAKGDLAWHLNRFWNPARKTWRTRRNPKWSKLAKDAVRATHKELVSTNREWEYVDPDVLVKEIIKTKGHYSRGWKYGIVDKVPGVIQAGYTDSKNLVNKMEEEFYDMWERFESYLPLKETPISVEVRYNLKKGIVCLHGDNHRVTGMKVVYDKNGKMQKMFGYPNHEHNDNSWNLSEMIEHSPEEMRNTWHYYKTHNYK